VEDDESDLAFFRRFDEADVAQRAQGRRQETGALAVRTEPRSLTTSNGATNCRSGTTRCQCYLYTTCLCRALGGSQF